MRGDGQVETGQRHEQTAEGKGDAASDARREVGGRKAGQGRRREAEAQRQTDRSCGKTPQLQVDSDQHCCESKPKRSQPSTGEKQRAIHRRSRT